MLARRDRAAIGRALDALHRMATETIPGSVTERLREKAYDELRTIMRRDADKATPRRFQP